MDWGAPPCGYCLKASMTGLSVVLSCSPSPLIPLPSRERGFGRLVLSCCCPVHPALWFPAYAGMTVRGVGWFGLFHPRSHVRHWDRLWYSAAKGEGIPSVVLYCCCPARPPLWIADQVRNDGLVVGFVLFTLPPCGYCLEASMTAGSVVLACFTLTFDSSPIKGEGDFCRLVVLSCCCPPTPCPSGLRIKSAMTGRATPVNQ